jgi:tRNA A-37 threonylcarbamoyl transferase component Bud32
MKEPIENTSLKELQKINYQLESPFQLKFNKQTLQCNDLIRVVPKKRLVFIGTVSQKNNDSLSPAQKVLIKLFIHKSRAKKHWQRELAGAQLLIDKKILTPELVSQGITDEGVYFLIFNYITGQNLATFWGKNKPLERENKLKDLIPVLEQHHRNGLAHQDLHYANFLLADSSPKTNSYSEAKEYDLIYTLDGEEVKSSQIPLRKKACLQNLALFLAQTFDLNQSTSLSLLDEYISLNSFNLSEKDKSQFLKWIKSFQQQRIKQYLKKIIRDCTEVIYSKQLKHSKNYSLCRREYHSQAVQQLLDNPENFFNNEDSLFLKQGNTCTVKSVVVENRRYVIKRYNPKGIAYELKHKGQISRAKKSWVNAHLLRFMGILTPEPIALIEQNNQLGNRCSYFISQYQSGQNSWDFFCDFCDNTQLDKNKEQAANKLISTLNKFCEYSIIHGDLKGSNFLINNNTVWVLDLDAMTQHKINWLFQKHWQRDRSRFLKNWDKKPCYKTWKSYFNHHL